jgi:hypothetical protein
MKRWPKIDRALGKDDREQTAVWTYPANFPLHAMHAESSKLHLVKYPPRTSETNTTISWHSKANGRKR